MATYEELHAILGNEPLRNKVAVAAIVAADTIVAEDAGTTNHANRLKWAGQIFRRPQSAGETMLPAIIAANSGATVAQILAATDAAILANVVAVVDTFADGS